MSVGDVIHHLAGTVSVVGCGLGPATNVPDWTYRPHPAGGHLPWRLQDTVPVPAPAPALASAGAPVAVTACDCGRKLDALLKVLGLPEGLRGLVLALAAAPDADPLDVLADHLEEAMDPRAGRFRELAARARGKGGAG
jgi:hypothetical protein